MRCIFVLCKSKLILYISLEAQWNVESRPKRHAKVMSEDNCSSPITLNQLKDSQAKQPSGCFVGSMLVTFSITAFNKLHHRSFVNEDVSLYNYTLPGVLHVALVVAFCTLT